MLNNFDEMVISGYSPISSKGGKRRRSRRHRTRKHKKSKTHSKNARTRRRYH
jgi:hypothetical protein